MAVQTIKFAGKKFVIIPESEYRKLERRASSARPSKPRPRLSAEDRYDIAEAKKALAEGSFIPWEQVKKELGI